ncbi:DUF899 domain-containing protein [Catenulispora yoronensis]|uniref:DUF899 domain-containing protein n=1 Tax=Catenulispora yoronensis TaxID=450799 RepID=A0ABP5GKQ8_9ACTN
MELPVVASPEEWRKARVELLREEKAATALLDRIAERRRALPMVEVVEPYVFVGRDGEASLLELFEGRRQLIVYHFMWVGDAGCPSCSVVADNMGHPAHLGAAETTLVMVSRAPWADIDRFQQRMGWSTPWYSSQGTGFNYDFHVTSDPEVAPIEYNYMDQAELEAKGFDYFLTGDNHGLSVFLRDGDQVFHTYSTYGRGCETLVGTYSYLDLTPLGRQLHITEFPHHDSYESAAGHCH